jgi:hypothetical protein
MRLDGEALRMAASALAQWAYFTAHHLGIATRSYGVFDGQVKGECLYLFMGPIRFWPEVAPPKEPA